MLELVSLLHMLTACNKLRRYIGWDVNALMILNICCSVKEITFLSYPRRVNYVTADLLVQGLNAQ